MGIPLAQYKKAQEYRLDQKSKQSPRTHNNYTIEGSTHLRLKSISRSPNKSTISKEEPD